LAEKNDGHNELAWLYTEEYHARVNMAVDYTVNVRPL